MPIHSRTRIVREVTIVARVCGRALVLGVLLFLISRPLSQFLSTTRSRGSAYYHAGLRLALICSFFVTDAAVALDATTSDQDLFLVTVPDTFLICHFPRISVFTACRRLSSFPCLAATSSNRG